MKKMYKFRTKDKTGVEEEFACKDVDVHNLTNVGNAGKVLAVNDGGTAIEAKFVGGGGGMFEPRPIVLRRKVVDEDNNTVTLQWGDPEDVVVNGIHLVDFRNTVVVKKHGSLPQSPTDGTVVVTSMVRNQYLENGYVDNQANGDEWFYRGFPFSTNDVYSSSRLNDFQFYLYGVEIQDINVSDPDEKVKQIPGTDNEFYDKPYMDFANDTFRFGGWHDERFVAFAGKSCMLKRDDDVGGVVDYYLNPDNLKQKEDGTASDVNNNSYDGNAMLELKTCFMKWDTNEDTGKTYIYLCSEKLDDGFEAYPWLKADGTYNKYFYPPIYRGTYGSNRIWSKSTNTVPSANQSMTTEQTWGENVGGGYSMSTWAWWMYLCAFYYIFFMHPASREKLGYAPGSSSALTLANGAGDDKGMYYGKQSGVTKFMGIENPFTLRWERVLGITTKVVNGVGHYFVKMTKHTGDGSTEDRYYTDGTGFVDTGIVVPSASNSFIKDIAKTSKLGFAPTVVGGSSTTYFCCAAWTGANPSGVVVGGSVINGASAGVSAFDSATAPSNALWTLGSSLEFRPQ